MNAYSTHTAPETRKQGPKHEGFGDADRTPSIGTTSSIIAMVGATVMALAVLAGGVPENEEMAVTIDAAGIVAQAIPDLRVDQPRGEDRPAESQGNVQDLTY